jgi:tetratricopeptide (TPR) repeat protein
MKHIIMVAAVCLAATACNSHIMPSETPVVNAEVQNEQNKTILAGHCSASVLSTAPYNEWFLKSWDNYTIDTFTLHKITPLLKNKTVEIFLGSWCGDSKREVPRMLKILQAAGVDTANIKLVFVDNSTKKYKQSPQHEEAGKHIHHVPTIIIYNHNGEMGRIIESPHISLEKDLLAILVHRAYEPKYNGVAYWIKHVKNRELPFGDDKVKQAATEIQPFCRSMGEFNAYGYVLLAQNNYTEALNVFKLNTMLFPAVAGTYDSLAEAYFAMGNKEQAKQNYEKVLDLKPGDENAFKMLEKLK